MENENLLDCFGNDETLKAFALSLLHFISRNPDTVWAFEKAFQIKKQYVSADRLSIRAHHP